MPLLGTACANLKVERALTTPPALVVPPTLHLQLIDHSGAAPSWPIDYLNTLWTPDDKRQRRAVQAAAELRRALEERKFVFSDSPNDAQVLAEFEIRGIRFDPIAGWITDGASIEFAMRENRLPIGTVSSESL